MRSRKDQEQFYLRAITYVVITGWTFVVVLGALKVFHDIGWL